MPNSYYENLGNVQTPAENMQSAPQVPPAPQMQSLPEVPSAPQAQELPPEQNVQENQSTMPNNSTGQLVVSVFTADQLYPVVGATVSVSADNGGGRDTLDTSTTDRSGRSKMFTLPAPSASMSQEPTAAIPFAEYRVTITHPDYFTAVIENVQLFGGIVTQQPVNLVPLPELRNGEIDRIVIIPRQNL